MWGAAPLSPRRVAHRLLAPTVLLTALCLAAPADAAPNTTTAPTTVPGSVWGLTVDRGTYGLLGPQYVRRLRAGGVNALVVRPGTLNAVQTLRVRALAAGAHLLVFVPIAEEKPSGAVSVSAAHAACRSLKLNAPGSRCSVYARTLASARAIAGRGAADVVIVPAPLRAVGSVRVSTGRLVLALALPAKKHFKRAAWRKAFARARANQGVDVTGDPVTRTAAVGSFLSTLKAVARGADQTPPSKPTGLQASDASGSRTALTWTASTDNRRVAAYGIYVDGVRTGKTTSPSASLPRLSCGAPHLLEVDAVDAAGNRSAKAAITASPGDCVPTPNPVAGLVAAYGFEEGGGPNATDSSGNGNTGSLSGASRTANGRFGSALSFDGQNDQVSVPDDSTLDLSGAMTIEAWVRPTSAQAGWRTVVMKEQSGDLVYGLYAAATGYRPSGHVFVGDDLRVQAPAALPANTWSHLATTYDGTTLRLYIDGAQVGSLGVSGPMQQSNGPVRIGGNTIWDEWFSGTMDDIRIYDRALGAAEILDDMGEPVGAPAPGDAQAPTTPGNLRTTGATGTSVSLAWDASTDDVGVTEYGVYRGGTLVWSGSGTSRTVSGLVCGTSYTFAVDAADAAGNRSPKATLTAATADCPSGPDTEAPTTPTGLAKTSSTQSSIAVSWNASSDNVGVTAYGVYRDGAPIATPSGTSYTFTGLACGTSYALAVDAADAAGNRSAQATVNASTNACPPPPDTQAPTTPGNLHTTGQTTTSVSLAWNAATDNTAVTGYGVYRNGSLVSSTAGLNATVSGLACGTTYTFAVDAYDAAANRSGQTSVSGSTSACPPPGSADLYVASGGSDSGQCTQANPCGSFNRAYAVASLGQTVEVAGGSYGGQTIDQTPKTGTGVVLFRPAPGASVTLQSITAHRVSRVEFRDFTVNSSTLNRQQASWITYRGIKMRQFLVRSADHISYIDSEVGPNGSEDGMNWITAAYQTDDPATDVLLDNVRIHDFSKHNSGAHVDCIGIDDVDGLVIRNSKLWNCEHFSIIFGNDVESGRASRNALLENNFFDCCYSGYYSLGFGDVEGPMMIRFNSMTLGMGWLGGSVVGLTFDSNVIDGNSSANCSKATWRYNIVADGSACGGGGAVAPTGFVREPDDLHLVAGAAAINFGNPTTFPETDIDGQARGGNRPDAGADERG
jgi:chitodextrinase